MKKILVLVFLMVMTIPVVAQSYNESDEENYAFYLKVGSGISSAQSADIVAVYPPWNEAIQGYDATLGHCPIASFSVGCELWHVVDFEVSISNRSIFQYRNYQIPTQDGGSYTREFDLSVTSILFSANFLGRGVHNFHVDAGAGKIYPMLGAGIGVSSLLITNYRTTGLPPSGDSSPFPSFSAENQYTLRKNFTYTVLAGLEYSYKDSWAIGTGYRWLNAGNFDGPQYVRSSTGSAVDLDGDQWQMRFRTNEWFIEFKIFM